MIHALGGAHALTLSRLIPAPRAAIWRCWTEPELLKQWFCPKPWGVSHAELDVRPGGSSVIVMRGPEGQATLKVEAACSVAEFRALLAEKTGVVPERQEVGAHCGQLAGLGC